MCQTSGMQEPQAELSLGTMQEEEGSPGAAVKRSPRTAHAARELWPVRLWPPEAASRGSARLRVLEDSLVAQTVKRLPAMREAWVQSLGREDPLEEEMATHCSALAWRIHGRRAWWAAVHGVAKVGRD